MGRCMQEDVCRDMESEVQNQNYIDKVYINLKRNVKYQDNLCKDKTGGKLDDTQIQYRRKRTLNHTSKWNAQTKQCFLSHYVFRRGNSLPQDTMKALHLKSFWGGVESHI